MNTTAKIKFLGGIGTVTGSCTAIEFTNETGTHLYLVDIGEFQGEACNTLGRDWLAKNAKHVEGIFITHAHYDHVGHLPELVMEHGFSGKVYCREVTKELMTEILTDSLKIKGIKKYNINEVYAKISFNFMDSNIRGKFCPLGDGFKVSIINSAHILGSTGYVFGWLIDGKWENVTFSGDIGPSCDLSYSNILLKEFQNPFLSQTGKHHIVLESTYGDRIRENKADLFERRINKLIEIIKDAWENKKPVLIPAFALNRSQEILLDLYYIQNNFWNEFYFKDFCNRTTKLINLIGGFTKNHKNMAKQYIMDICKNNFSQEEDYWEIQICDLPENMKADIYKVFKKYSIHHCSMNVKIYSTLMSKINKIYKKHILRSFPKKNGMIGFEYLPKIFFEKFGISNLSDEEKLRQAQEIIHNFLGNIKELQNVDKSDNFFQLIISSSGMCDDGKVMELLKKFLPNENAIVLLTGYQAKNTNGLHLKNMHNYQNNEKLATELHNLSGLRLSDVKCAIIDMSEFYSGHADQDMLYRYVKGGEIINEDQTNVFLQHGTNEQRNALKERLKTAKNVTVEIPMNMCWYNLNTGEQNQD
ncbi:MAG: MBL fold metallo-hydrolase [Chitinispirillales bacterium]|jgi:metallo-beta-lactamase family protein|nr:MBL fold metallo-hydrolase [Chitinispirillales bacterium]